MSKGVNKAIILGNLGQDPEIRYMPSGGAAATLSIATSDKWKDKQSGEMQERTEWHRVVLFNRLAEIAGEYLHQGSKIYIEGSLRTRKWQDKQGVERYTTEIVGSEMQMLDVHRDNSGGSKVSQQSSSTSQNYAAVKSGAAPMRPPTIYPEDFDDDIPF